MRVEVWVTHVNFDVFSVYMKFFEALNFPVKRLAQCLIRAERLINVFNYNYYEFLLEIFYNTLIMMNGK